MGESGKDFLPEDIFAETEIDNQTSMFSRPQDEILAKKFGNESQIDGEADISKKNGYNLETSQEVKQKSKASKKILLVLLFVFIACFAFLFVKFLANTSLKNKDKNVSDDQQKQEQPAKKDENLLVDTDLDGLFDIEEREYGTDIRSNDTDGDNLSDYEEIRMYKTNPLNPDTDGDGLSDYDEVIIYKTNPLSSDTDGDGHRDLDEINNGYSPIDGGKMMDEYIKSIEEAKKNKEGLNK